MGWCPDLELNFEHAADPGKKWFSMGRQKRYESIPTSGRSIRRARSPLENRNVGRLRKGKNMNKIFAILTVGLLLGVGVCVTNTLAQGKQETKNLSRLQVVTYASGLTGFFDPESGKLYIYDSNVENCVVIRQISRLGDPLMKIRN